MNAIQESLRIVFGDHRDNVARFNVRSPDGDYTVEFTVHQNGDAYWNLASYPPSGPPPSFEVVDSDENTYWLVKSDASDVETARDELEQLLPSTGGEHARIRRTKTFHSPEIKSLREWAAELKDVVRRALP